MNRHYDADLSELKFDYLKDTRFQKVYEILVAAKKLDKTDKSACCNRLRTALESVVAEVIKICGLEDDKQSNISGNLAVLRDEIPLYLRLYNGMDILEEMDKVRLNGNFASHYNERSDVELIKATYTCWLAMEKICKWVSGFEPVYMSYLSEHNSSYNSSCGGKDNRGFLEKYGEDLKSVAIGLFLAWGLYNSKKR